MDIDDPSESNESEIQSSPVDVIELSPEDESGLALIATDSESGSEEAQATMLRVPFRDDSSTTFCSHSSPVFCVRACNSRSVGKQFCLTGGQDDRARLRDLSSDKQVFECSGWFLFTRLFLNLDLYLFLLLHSKYNFYVRVFSTAHTESVVACGFSDDGSLFASADMNGDLFAYRLSDVLSQSSAPSTPITPLLSSSCGSELHWLEWHPSSPVLLGGAADGTLWLWHVPSGATKALPGAQAAHQFAHVDPFCCSNRFALSVILSIGELLFRRPCRSERGTFHWRREARCCSICGRECAGLGFEVGCSTSHHSLTATADWS